MAYATITELEAGWRPLHGNERNVAVELLDRASSLLDARIISAGEHPVSVFASRADVMKVVVCDAVRYSFVSGSYGGNPFDESGVGAMAGDMVGSGLQITDTHMRMLGIGGTSAGFIGFHHGG